jgi:lipid II:glycine glycyltransferase (peptidoglycan interpeptide bridge formation enzyme)
MNIRYASNDETAVWNERILANPDGGNLFQGSEFAVHKKLSGWTPRYILANNVAITAHEKSIPLLGKFWYLPKGPGVQSANELTDLLPELKEFAARNGVFAIKIESEIEKLDHTKAKLAEAGLVPTGYIQPNLSTVLIDLTPNIDQIMASLNQKGRHAIKRAERDGVTVTRVDTTDDNCELFYRLLSQTAENQGFSASLRSYDYHAKFWQRYTASGQGQLFLASFNGTIIAGAFAILYGQKSTYKDGASMRVEGAYGVTHLLQWNVIQWAKKNGAIVHDLCGTPPSDRINDETHRWYGVGRFKTSFNKHVTDYIGAYDLSVQPLKYRVWTAFGERATKSLWWRTHHESWY